jgi:hypothetical protein
MYEYEIELIHEPSGTAMNFNVQTDEKIDEVELSRLIWSEMSVVVLAEYEGVDND